MSQPLPSIRAASTGSAVSRGGCGGGCTEPGRLTFDFTFAFQPIVDVPARRVFGHEALVRGLQGEGALSVLCQVDEGNRYAFDQACRVKAIEAATACGLGGILSINFLPNAIYEPRRCLSSTLAAAKRLGFPLERLMFEVAESEHVHDPRRLANILREYQKTGLLTAIDDFGAGYAGLTLLADCPPDLIKLDMGLVRDIDRSSTRRAIVGHLARMCEELNVQVVAEGIETAGERDALLDVGVKLMQGYLFARPAFRSEAAIDESAWRSPA